MPILQIITAPLRYLVRYRRYRTLMVQNGLRLPLNGNLSNLETLQAVFQRREYADYFPFYQKVNILDVGAHRGYFSLFASMNVAPASSIVALEPNAVNHAFLTQNLKSNDIKNVVVRRAAIHTADDEVQLRLGASVNHSIIKDHSNGIHSNFEIVEGICMETVMQENNLDVIDFLKMDCEGAEYEVLFQLPKAVFNKIKVISLEFHDLKKKGFTANDLEKHLLNMGFEILVFTYSPTYRNLNYGRIVARNVFSV